MYTLYEPELFASEKIPIRTFFHHLEGRDIYTFLHWHQNIELSVTTRGRILSLIGNENRVCEEGDLVIINNGVIHANHWVDLQDVYEGVVVQIGKSFIDDWLGKNVYLKLPETPEGYQALRETLIALRRTCEKEGSELEQMEQLFHLMRILKEHCIDDRPGARKNGKIKVEFTEILKYMDDRYQEPLSLNSTADEFHYTPEYLSRLFRENTGFTYHAYLQNVRLLHSLDSMQREPERKLLDVALENGFPNARSFIQTFKLTFGCTPSVWLQKRQNSDEALLPDSFQDLLAPRSRKMPKASLPEKP